MAVAPFEQTCTGCHLDQIVGKERVSGPKGIAFLTLPGLDLQTLKRKNAAIGEWPDASEAELTPFMKVMISQDQRGRALIKTVEKLNLQDLTGASDDQIKAVTSLVWEIKVLFYALISGNAADGLADLKNGARAKPSAEPRSPGSGLTVPPAAGGALISPQQGADGSRLHVVIPDITRDHWYVNVRKFVVKADSMDDLVKTKVMSEGRRTTVQATEMRCSIPNAAQSRPASSTHARICSIVRSHPPSSGRCGK